MKRLTLASLLFLGAAPAVAADWHFENAGTAEARYFVIFIDASTVQRHGNLVRYWIDERFSKSSGDGSIQANRFVQFQEADCSEHKRRIISENAYLDDVFVLDTQPEGKWEYQAPDTNGYGEIDRICARKWAVASVASDHLTDAARSAFQRFAQIEASGK